MPSIEELKNQGLKKDKGNTITESDYRLRTKTAADLGVNTIIMDSTAVSKYADLIEELKATTKETKASK